MIRARKERISRRVVSLVVSVTFCIFALGLLFAGGRAQAQFAKTYDWTIEIETKAVKNKFQFPGSGLTELSRLKIHYYKGTDKSSAEVVHYEDLWYSGEKIIGCRRHHAFGLTPGEQLVIKVVHSSDEHSEGETRAAADAIVRMVIDAYANRSMTSAITVPQGSMHEIVEGMSRLGFSPAAPPKPDEPVYALMILQIYSEPAGEHQIMQYSQST